MNNSKLSDIKTLVILSVVTFLGFIDTVLLLPIISLYAEELGATIGVTGLIVGLYSIANTPANILFGKLIDKIGQKLPLFAGLLGDAVCLFLYSLCRVPAHLAAVRFFHGVAGGMVGPATMSALSECSLKSGRGRIMGIYGIAIASATMIGYPVSGLIATRLGYDALFYITSTLLFLASLFALALPRRVENACENKSNDSSSFSKILNLLKRPGLRVAYISIVALYFSFGGLITLLPFHIANLGFDAMHVGILLGMFSLTFILVQVPVGRMSDSVGRLKPAAFGLLLCLVSLALLPSMENMLSLGITMAVFGVSFGFIFPSISSLVIDNSQSHERGLATGVFHALLTVGVAGGAPVVGAIGQWIG
ncbi:MAG: MFS transporter, partial [Dehalococcoidales bacterium]|nr:MFS transporter [Dehalococcoidales bacterium]